MKVILVALLVANLFAGVARAFELGDYLEDEFLADLRRTRSPYAAVSRSWRYDDGRSQAINVSRAERGLVFTGNLNWHEGDVPFVRRDDGSIEMPAGYAGVDPPTSVIEDRKAHFVLREKGKSLGYTFVGDGDWLITEISVVGHYKDNHGNQVSFGCDGNLSNPVIHGPFTMTHDHVLDPYDFFLLGPKSERVIAYRWRHGRLTLYPIIPGDGSWGWGKPDYRHPLAVLTPVITAPTPALGGRACPSR